jgi:predicted RNase H-like HicB family nuclease
MLLIMKARFTYWKETDGRYLGFLNDCPDHWTQGDDLADLKEQLHDLLELFGAEASAASVPGRSAQREAWAVDRARGVDVKRREESPTHPSAGSRLCELFSVG